MRRFIGARMRQAYPSGDWFATRALTALTPAQEVTLRMDRERQQREVGATAPAEAVLDVQHFNQVILRNRDAFEKTFGTKATWNRVLTWMREVGDSRNEWAHPPLGDSDPGDVDRLLDTCERILQRVDAEVAKQVAALREGKIQPSEPAPVDTPPPPPPATLAGKGPVANLSAWRDLVTPHPDVQAGRYVKAEFAADLQQVHDGRATAEYGDAREFFDRTFVTADMKRLLAGVVRRLHGETGDPVYDLKTAFGGGKTHTMLAVYHLAKSPDAIAGHPDVRAIYDEAGGAPKKAAVAVLVGTHLDPATPHRLQEDTGGVEIHTLWGEMAWQLAGMQGYQMLADHDSKGRAPGSAVLERLFALAGPS
ncbi:MAG: ATP-binding protein, partial [Dehalococcoidia bacterium]